MALERTFSIIKPDATKRNLTGKINAKFEDSGLRIIAQKRIHLTMEQAGEFYGVHRERPFYVELCEFMASAPIVAQVLEGELPAAAEAAGTFFDTQPADLRTAIGQIHRVGNVWRHLKIGVATAVFRLKSSKKAVAAILPAHRNFNSRLIV